MRRTAVKTFRSGRVAAMLAALYGCVTLYGCASESSSARSAASLSSVVSVPAIPTVRSIPFVWNGAPEASRVPAPQPNIPRTGGPPRIDCTDATVTGTGQLSHGRGTITVTSRPDATVCDLADVATKAQLADAAGPVLPVRSIDPTAAITTNPPDYGWLQLGHGGPGSNQLTSVSFTVEWDGAYCGPAPTRLLLYDSSWVGDAGVPITVMLTNSSSPCGTTSVGADDGTITVYPANGYPLAAPEWAGLQATVRSVSGTSVPTFVVRLTNPTGDAVPLRPCFTYGIGFVSSGLSTGHGGMAESFDGNPDCAQLPTSLAPHASLDLPINPAELDQQAQSDVPGGTWTWLMPGGPSASFVFPASH